MARSKGPTTGPRGPRDLPKFHLVTDHLRERARDLNGRAGKLRDGGCNHLPAVKLYRDLYFSGSTISESSAKRAAMS